VWVRVNVKVSELLAEGFTGNGIRLALLAHHYREDRDFDRDLLRTWEERARLLERAAGTTGAQQDHLKVQPSAKVLVEFVSKSVVSSAARTWHVVNGCTMVVFRVIRCALSSIMALPKH